MPIPKWFPEHKCSLSLSYNEHKLPETPFGTIEEAEFARDMWISEAEREAAIQRDEMWCLQWYPNTPVGFNIVAASSLEALEEHFANDTHEAISLGLEWLPYFGYKVELRHNAPRDYYQSVEASILEEERAGRKSTWVSQEEKLRAVATDERWDVEYYMSPEEYVRVSASSLEALEQYFLSEARLS